MEMLTHRYVTDEAGARVAVILDIQEYNRLLEILEDQADLLAYREAKANAGEVIPLDQALAEIEREPL